jgi:uncharacterized protein YjbJ (UPF0337 family)
MNKEIVKGRWKEIKGKVKQKWGKLTDDEITQMKGSYEELTGTLQKRYGYKKEQAETELNAFLEENHFDDDR